MQAPSRQSQPVWRIDKETPWNSSLPSSSEAPIPEPLRTGKPSQVAESLAESTLGKSKRECSSWESREGRQRSLWESSLLAFLSDGLSGDFRNLTALQELHLSQCFCLKCFPKSFSNLTASPVSKGSADWRLLLGCRQGGFHEGFLVSVQTG